MKTPDICPVCFEEVPPRAKACPYCGADERSGWREDAMVYDGLDLPEEAWEETESESEPPSARKGKRSVPGEWRAGVVVILLAVAVWRLLSRWLA